MKTIRTTFGNKTIVEQNQHYIPGQISKLLAEHRAKLIDKLLQNDLQHYIEFRFQKKADMIQIRSVRYKLIELRDSVISPLHYASVIDDIRKYNYMILTDAIFYRDIHATILENCSQRELFGREFNVTTTPVRM